jgi:hypothetical protein
MSLVENEGRREEERERRMEVRKGESRNGQEGGREVKKFSVGK